MAQYSMSTATVQRSSGSSAVAHAAYVSGAVLTDARTGQESDYTHRGGVEFVAPAIVVPAAQQGTKSAGIERGRLWNMAEAAEKRKDGTPARKVLVALPHELQPEQRQAVVQEYAQWLADRYGVAVDYAIHQPDKEGDQRNFHAHMILTTRQLRDGHLAEKSHLEWEGKKLKAAGLPSGKAMVHEMRERWEDVHNRALRQHAPEVAPVSCQTLKAQRETKLTEADRLTAEGRTEEAVAAKLAALELDRTPQQHVGWHATSMERRGIQTERGEMRRAAQEEHKERLGLVAQARQRIAELIERGKAAALAAIAKVTERQVPTQKPPATEPTHHDPRVKELLTLRDELLGIEPHAARGEAWRMQHRPAEAICAEVFGGAPAKEYLRTLSSTLAPGQQREQYLAQLGGTLTIRRSADQQLAYVFTPDQHPENAKALARYVHNAAVRVDAHVSRLLNPQKQQHQLQRGRSERGRDLDLGR